MQERCCDCTPKLQAQPVAPSKEIMVPGQVKEFSYLDPRFSSLMTSSQDLFSFLREIESSLLMKVKQLQGDTGEDKGPDLDKCVEAPGFLDRMQWKLNTCHKTAENIFELMRQI